MAVLGRYELLRPLARGGMAEVFLARRRVAGVEKRLVVKRMRRDRGGDPRFLEMFVREAQLSMSLVQQNIVPVFDFGRIGDDVFLAMEHIDGKDLGSTLARVPDTGLPPVLAAFIAHEACAALDHAHGRRDEMAPNGVIHRDVSPRNILLSWGGEVKLADFGIAAVGQAGEGMIGTPAYMAPEQALGQPVDPRVDVYALGIVLWEAVIGGRVRPSANRAETLMAARSGDLPAIADAVPEQLAAIIRRATARDPADRWPTARDMAIALDGFIVAERVRVGARAPSVWLRDWLRGLWGDVDDDVGTANVEPGGQVVTFLDDGVDEVRATERSIAETAAGAPPPPIAAEPQPAGLPTPAPLAIAPTASPRRARWQLAIAAIVVAGIAIVVGARIARPPTAERPVPPEVSVSPASAPPAVEVPVPQPPPLSSTETRTDHAPATGSAGAAPGKSVEAPARPPQPRPAIELSPPSARAAPAPPPPAPTRPITIGAVPWAYVTVDDDPTVHESGVTLQLTVGSHRVTFSNPKLGVVRTVTIEVPAEGTARHVERLDPR